MSKNRTGRLPEVATRATDRIPGFRAGVHLANDGHLTDEQWDLLTGLQLVKGLLRLDNMGHWGELDWRRLADVLDPAALVILRLYFPGRLEASEFGRRAIHRLAEVVPVLKPREVLIELHNEPNHCTGLEGWGKDEALANDFAWWYCEVRHLLRQAGWGRGRLGWPGLALGEWAHGERTWAIANQTNIRTTAWVGCHCYWQRRSELNRLDLGGNWRWYRRTWPKKRVIVTEVANSSRDNSELPPLTPGEQLEQYLRWCKLAARGGVAGVAFYMLGGSADWGGFELWPDTVRALASFSR